MIITKKVKNSKLAVEHFWKQQFESAKNPKVWLSFAYDLKYAADTLCKISKKSAMAEHNNFLTSINDGTFKNGQRQLSKKEAKLRSDAELSKKCYFLWGFAFENLLKGILISKHPDFVKIQGIDKQLKTHNLIVLAEKCTIKLYGYPVNSYAYNI